MKRNGPAIARAFVNIPEWEECGQGRNRVCAPARNLAGIGLFRPKTHL